MRRQIGAKQKWQERKERLPLHRWAGVHGIPIMSIKYCIDTKTELHHLRGRSHLSVDESRLVAEVVRRTNCP